MRKVDVPFKDRLVRGSVSGHDDDIVVRDNGCLQDVTSKPSQIRMI